VVLAAVDGEEVRLTGTDPHDPLLKHRFIAFPSQDESEVDPTYHLSILGAESWYDMEVVPDHERPGWDGEGDW